MSLCHSPMSLGVMPSRFVGCQNFLPFLWPNNILKCIKHLFIEPFLGRQEVGWFEHVSCCVDNAALNVGFKVRGLERWQRKAFSHAVESEVLSDPVLLTWAQPCQGRRRLNKALRARLKGTASFPLVPLRMLTVSVWTIHHSFLLQEDCGLGLFPYRELLLKLANLVSCSAVKHKPTSLIRMYKINTLRSWAPL